MLRNTYILPRFYVALAIIIVLFVVSYSVPILFAISKYLLILLMLTALVEYFFTWRLVGSVTGTRKVNEKLSLGDEQLIEYELQNNSNYGLNIELVDEFPIQLQHRDRLKKISLNGTDSVSFSFPITPVERGSYKFGILYAYTAFRFPGFIQNRLSIVEPMEVVVYPSIIQMRKYELQLASRTASLSGIRRVRRVGENDEFEYIRNYVVGDNIKSINWKATSRKNELMVNQYQNTRSQMVYCILDKGRSMKMPFYDMTLLDHSVNAALVISNIVLKHYDKVGLISFSNKLGQVVKAESNQNQLERITKYLYDQKTGFLESNFELLFYTIRRKLTRRSILLLFTNFEQRNDLDRNLPYLRAIAKLHLLILIIFINEELLETTEMECASKSDIYLKTFAQKVVVDKQKIKDRLESNGIQCILTKPSDLSINVINKYLEIKSRRMS